MRRIFIIMLLSVFALSFQSFAELREWEDNQVTGVNRQDGRSTFWYYPSLETALKGGYCNCPTNQTLNGKWKFSFANTVEERVADFYKTSYDVSAWGDIQVPGSWSFQGYDRPVYLNHPHEFALKNPYPTKLPKEWSPVGSYRRNFTVPADWKDQRVVLHFGAVKSSFYVWVNGVKVGYSQDSKMQAEFDITPYIKEGENTLAVEVYRFSIGSYIECQDFWRLAGIKRDVWIYATPKSYIKDFAVKAGLENNYTDGLLTVDVDLATIAGSKKQNIGLQLLDAEGKVVYTATKAEKATTKKDGKLTFTASVTNVNKWSGETPYLYTLSRVK